MSWGAIMAIAGLTFVAVGVVSYVPYLLD